MSSVQKNLLSLRLALALGLLLAQSAFADSAIYKYRENDGTNWYTDRALPNDQYTLVETIGRPTASASCTGVTRAVIEQRASAHASIIEQYAQFYSVDARLVKAIISVESCFDRYAVSRVGARGLMQLMPATAERMGVHDSFNANENVRGGIRYFSEMLARFEKNVELALAAYNAGPGAVQKHNGIPPYKETQNYIKRVLDYYGSDAAGVR